MKGRQFKRSERLKSDIEVQKVEEIIKNREHTHSLGEGIDIEKPESSEIMELPRFECHDKEQDISKPEAS